MHLEGGTLAVSISQTVMLPEQPTVGETIVQPLGGNGYAAPQSQIFCEVVQASDASGGYNRIIVELEDNHAHMIGFVGMRVQAASGDVVSAPTIRASKGQSYRDTFTIQNAPVLTQARGLWRPPPIFCRTRAQGSSATPQVEIYIPNTNGETFTIDLLAYQFQPEASQVTAWPFLVANFAS